MVQHYNYKRKTTKIYLHENIRHIEGKEKGRMHTCNSVQLYPAKSEDGKINIQSTIVKKNPQ